jgi:multidrug transporter EmrE-like cation transporter
MPFIATWILFAAYTLLSVGGMVVAKRALPALKIAMSQGHDWLAPATLVALGGGMYVCSFLTWMVILSRSPLMSAYPTAVGLTMAFSTICAMLFLGESLTVASVAGVLLIFAGVVVLARAAVGG